MGRLFDLFLLLWMSSRVNGQEAMDAFINDLVATFQLRSPTILYDNDDEIPEICYNTSRWAHCLSSSDPEVLSANRESENEGMMYIVTTVFNP